MEGVREERPSPCEEMTELRKDIQEIRAEMNSRFDAMQRLIIRGGWGLFGTLLIGFLSLVLTQH
jgi:hypothetical protein